MINITYEIEYEITVKGIEPFTIVSSKIVNFLKQLIKDDLISGYTLKTIIKE